MIIRDGRTPLSKQIARELRKQAGHRRALETSLRREFRIQLNKSGRLLVQAEDLGQGLIAIDAMLDERRLILGRVLSASYYGVFEDMGRDALRLMLTGKRGLDFEFLRDQWIRDAAAKKIKYVTETTKMLIRFYLAKWLSEGETIYSIGRKLLAKNFAGLSLGRVRPSFRAQTIARTEVHQASVAATHQGVAASQLEPDKEWITVTDGRERPEHRAANGQIVRFNEAFIVGGEKLMYPGDLAGSAENVINCRCQTAYILED